MAEKTKGLTGLVSNAMIGIGSLTADKKNTHDGYNYISSDKFLEEIGKSLGDLSVIVIPGITEVAIDKYDRVDNKVMFSARVSMQMTVKSGEEEITVPWFGCGVDYRVPDKAVYKAITSGHSYFLRKLLMIGVGNEDGQHDPAEGFDNESDPNKDIAPAEYPVNLPKAKQLFGGKEPTIAELFAKDASYCDWVYQNVHDKPIGDKMREFIDTVSATNREGKETGRSQALKEGNVKEAISNIWIILNNTTGNLTPDHFWPNVRKMGLDETKAADFASIADDEGGWREALLQAVKYVEGLK